MDTKLLQKFLTDLKKNRALVEKKIKDLENTEFIATAGGGLCEIVMNGKHEVIRCRLDDSILGDKETIQDLVVAAVTEVVNRINREIKELQRDMMPMGMF